jgi:ATP-dependent Clp protease ATP-binding subunit ClpB
MDLAEREYDLKRVAELKYGLLTALEKDLKAVEAESQSHEQKLLKEEVTEEEIARIVTNWTGIPVSRLLETERDKLINLEGALHARVVGQEAAVKAVADAVIRARAGIKDPNRPIGSFIFLGPTGVGKTELSRALAEAMFESDDAMIRIDMSEYQEKHTIARLIGAPPGYVGYDEGGQLTEAVRRKPFSVILFDEIEKAHREVFSTLLQLLDDGRLTDGHGRTVDFKNSVIILTSNIGSDILLENVESDTISESVREAVLERLRKGFPPEFLNRIDEIVMFEPLTPTELTKIVALQLSLLTARLSSQDLKVNATGEAMSLVARLAYDPHYGARPLKRFISQNIESVIARRIVQGDLPRGSVVTIDAEADQLIIQQANPSPV